MREESGPLRAVAACLLGLATTLGAAQSGGDIAQVKKFYREGLKKNGIVGSGLVLIRDGKVVGNDFQGYAWLDPRQPVTENTTFHWASITKTPTAIGTMQFRDRGLNSRPPDMANRRSFCW